MLGHFFSGNCDLFGREAIRISMLKYLDIARIQNCSVELVLRNRCNTNSAKLNITTIDLVY